MKKIGGILVVCLIVSLSGYSQNDVRVLTNRRPVGQNLVTGEPVVAKEYVFSERIHKFYVDTVKDVVLVQLRAMNKNGRLANRSSEISYDLSEKRVLWTNYIPYRDAATELIGDIALRQRAGKVYRVNTKTGEVMWATDIPLVYTDALEKIGFGYKTEDSYVKSNNTLRGVDLTDGNTIWEREIPRGYSLNAWIKVNDSVMVISAAGLHELNLRDGKGWDYDAVTGSAKYGTLGVNDASQPLGFNTITGIASNIYMDSLRFCFASRYEIVCLDREGGILWRQLLPGNLSSESHVFNWDNSLILVNMGFAHTGNNKIDFGGAYLASFDLKSGTQRYLVSLSDNGEGALNGFFRCGKELYLATDNQIRKFDLEDGQLKIYKQLDETVYSRMKYFVGDRGFVRRDSVFVNVNDSTTAAAWLWTSRKRTLALTDNIEIIDEIYPEEMYISYLEKNDLRFMANNDSTFVVDRAGKKIAEYSGRGNSIVRDGKLYNTLGRVLREIDLGDLVED